MASTYTFSNDDITNGTLPRTKLSMSGLNPHKYLKLNAAGDDIEESEFITQTETNTSLNLTASKSIVLNHSRIESMGCNLWLKPSISG